MQPGQTGLNPEDPTPLDGSDPETKLIKSVLNHIPDPKYTDKNAVMGGDTDPEASMNVPASMWKHSVVRDGLDLQGWSTVKANLMSAFGQGEKDYTLKEKLALLHSQIIKSSCSFCNNKEKKHDPLPFGKEEGPMVH